MKDFIGNAVATAVMWTLKIMCAPFAMCLVAMPAYLIDPEAGEKIFTGYWGDWS